MSTDDRTNCNSYHKQCSFCASKVTEEAIAIEGQNAVICRQCLNVAEEAAGDTQRKYGSLPHVTTDIPATSYCAFCGKPNKEVVLFVKAPLNEVLICGACIIAPTPSKVLLGTDTQTGQEIRIDDTARRSGVYVLGKSGMGKSALLTSMAIQDAQNGHGLFFLDPHDDAITAVAIRLPEKTTPIILDIEDEERTFGINLLACRNRDSLQERTATYTRAYNAFKKIFQDEKGEWGHGSKRLSNTPSTSLLKTQATPLPNSRSFSLTRSFGKPYCETSGIILMQLPFGGMSFNQIKPNPL